MEEDLECDRVKEKGGEEREREKEMRGRREKCGREERNGQKRKMRERIENLEKNVTGRGKWRKIREKR